MLSIPNGLESSVGKVGSITMQELERAKVIEACVKGEITVAVAARRLQVTSRQVRRLQKRFAEGGLDAMASRHRGKPSNNQLAPGLAKKALHLVRDHYGDFGPTLACEQLRDRQDHPVEGDVARRDDRRRVMDSESGPTYAPASAPGTAAVRGRVGSDRWQPPSLVRAAGSCLYLAGLCR